MNQQNVEALRKLIWARGFRRENVAHKLECIAKGQPVTPEQRGRIDKALRDAQGVGIGTTRRKFGRAHFMYSCGGQRVRSDCGYVSARASDMEWAPKGIVLGLRYCLRCLASTGHRFRYGT